MQVKSGWEGRYFEDFVPGDVYRHPLGRTITENDNIWFTLLTMNTAQMHFNTPYAARSEFEKPLVVSTLTLAIVVGQSVIDTTQNAFANLGFEKVAFTKPVFAGDTLWAESVVLATRESASRPYAGLVTLKTRGLNQDGDEVLAYVRTFYIYKRGAEQVADVFPRASTPLTMEM